MLVVFDETTANMKTNDDVESGLYSTGVDNTRETDNSGGPTPSGVFASSGVGVCHELAGQGILRGITPPFVSSTPLQKFFNDHPQVRESMSREAGVNVGVGITGEGGGGGGGGLSQRASSTSLGLSPRGSMTSPRRDKSHATFDLTAPPGNLHLS